MDSLEKDLREKIWKARERDKELKGFLKKQSSLIDDIENSDIDGTAMQKASVTAFLSIISGATSKACEDLALIRDMLYELVIKK